LLAKKKSLIGSAKGLLFQLINLFAHFQTSLLMQYSSACRVFSYLRTYIERERRKALIKSADSSGVDFTNVFARVFRARFLYVTRKKAFVQKMRAKNARENVGEIDPRFPNSCCISINGWTD